MIRRFGMSQKPMPNICPDCKARLGKEEYTKPYSYGQWQKVCKCGCKIVWSYPHHFVRRHELPLWDMPNLRDVLGSA